MYQTMEVLQHLKNLKAIAIAAILIIVAFFIYTNVSANTDVKTNALGAFSGPTQITQFYPYGEWEISGVAYNGNPYDIDATAVFTGTSGAANGQVRTVKMFYDGDSGSTQGIWKFRFNGDLTGEWSIATTSDDIGTGDVNGDLDGWAGSVTVVANANNVLKRGFVVPNTANPNKWSRSGLDGNYAFSPTFVMAASPSEYFFTPGKLEGDLDLFVYNHNQTAEAQTNHGFDGFNLPVYCRWFDIAAVDGECDTTGPNQFNNFNKRNPDRRTFEALEQVINHTYERGGMTHLWLWGNTLEDQNLNDGSYSEGLIGSTTANRLYEYIVARLGAVPGWTMGFGNNLDEWAFNPEIEYWYDYMESESTWMHLLTSQGKYNPNTLTAGDATADRIDGELNNNTDRLLPLDDIPANDDNGTTFDRQVGLTSNELNTYSWADSQPSYNLLLNLLGSVPPSGGAVQPHFSELRFMVGDYDASNAYTYLMAGRGQAYLAMTGGIASIWGNVGSPFDENIIDGTSTSLPFDLANHFAGSVSNVDAARQHPGGDTTAYSARQHLLNRAIIVNRYLKADMVNCTASVIRDSEDGSAGFSLNDGSGVCLESPSTGDELIIIYEEEVGPANPGNTNIQLDLSNPNYTAVKNARAIDLRASTYSELNITGSISNTAVESWSPASGASDWVLILNVDDGNSPPDPIIDLTAIQQDQAVLLNWTEPNDQGTLIDNYQVEYRDYTNPGSPGAWSSPFLTNSISNTFTAGNPDFTLVVGNTYQFRVAAINNEGTATYDDPGSYAEATIVTIPNDVADLAAVEDGANAIELTWSAPSNGGAVITDYIVEYKLTSAPDTDYTIFDDGILGSTGATVAGLQSNTDYSFRVKAQNVAGVSANYSNVATATTAIGLPSSTPLYRFYNPSTSAHFYTSSASQRNRVINDFPAFDYEGQRGLVFTSGLTGNPDIVPVFRFYNASTGAHFYTASTDQRDRVISDFPQFEYESVAFYVYRSSYGGTGAQSVYRFYNTEAGVHFYTNKVSERDTILNDPRFEAFDYEGEAYKVPTN